MENLFLVVGNATSLLPADVLSIITGFTERIAPTVSELYGIIVPVGLAVWAMGFGVKRGIAFVMQWARTAL